MKNNLKEITNVLRIALQDVFKKSEISDISGNLKKSNNIVNDFAAQLDTKERNKFIKSYNKLNNKGKKIFSSFIEKIRKTGKNKDKQKILEKILNKAKRLNKKHSIEKDKIEKELKKKQELKKSQQKAKEKNKEKDKKKNKEKNQEKKKEKDRNNNKNNYNSIVRDGLDADDYIKQSSGPKTKASILHDEGLEQKIKEVSKILQKAVSNEGKKEFLPQKQKLGRSI